MLPWRDGTREGGLRQLTVPTRNEVERLRSSTEFLQAVMDFCPRVEYLDGWEKVVLYGDAQCEEMWVISLETWEAFNAKCTNLRTFSWAVMPFADHFFRVFGDQVKPQLKTLSLSANKCWNYGRYFRECEGAIVRPPIQVDDDEGDGEEIADDATRPGFGLLATEPSTVFRACPALTSLSIEINQLHNGMSQYVNTNIYGDEFWEAVAEHCPLLESIGMDDCSGYANFNIQSIDTLTDKTLLTLSRMKRLSNVELAPARLTGKGVFEYLRQVTQLQSSGNERTIQIQLGGHQHDPLRTQRFYTQIVKLLKLLSETSEDTLGVATCRQRQVVYIKNPYESKVDRIWCELYMRDQLMPLLEAVQAKHPSLGLSVWLTGRRGNVFSRIDFICLKWQPETDFDRQLFQEWQEEDAERDTYRDAAMYERISGDGGDDNEDDEEEHTIQDLVLWQVIMARFMHQEED